MNPTKLLMIDDDRARQAEIAAGLASAGHRIHLSSDGGEALDATREHEPDVVFCRNGSDGLDATGYCRRIRSDPQLKGTYVAVLAAAEGAADRARVLDAGADAMLVEPFDLEELLVTVRVGQRSRGLQRELAEARHGAALLEMAATLGHEINNPLTALFGHLELVLQNLEGGDLARSAHHVQEAARVAGRIAEVTQRLASLQDPRTKVYLDSTQMLDL